MFFFQEGFTYRNFLMDMLAVFAFVVWFWLLVVIYSDLFRRHDITGWGQALWVLSRLNRLAMNCDKSSVLASQTKLPNLIS